MSSIVPVAMPERSAIERKLAIRVAHEALAEHRQHDDLSIRQDAEAAGRVRPRTSRAVRTRRRRRDLAVSGPCNRRTGAGRSASVAPRNSAPRRALHLASAGSALQRHDDLAEMLVGFHVLERLADIVECEHLVDRQLQLALLHRTPDILADFAKNLADFLDRAGWRR